MCIFSRWQYMPYFEDMSLQVTQPDLTSCGGLTEGKKICDIAHIYDVAIQLHICGTPLSTALAPHLESAIPKEHRCCLNRYMKVLCTYNYPVINGMRTAPELPGIGNKWSEKAIREAKHHVLVDQSCCSPA